MRIRNALAPLSVALLLASTTNAAWGEGEKHGASRVDPIEGSKLHRVILTDRAAARLGIQTDVVSGREISRSHRILGAAMVPPHPEALVPLLAGGGHGPTTVIHALRTIEASSMALGHAASICLTGKAGAIGNQSARLIAIIEAETPDKPDDLFFVVDAVDQGLGLQQQVLVEFTTTEPRRKTIQSAALVYDAGGETWVFVSPEPLVYVRHQVDVDFVQQDWAVLTDGPPEGTLVVTGGAMLLLGTEFGMGH